MAIAKTDTTASASTEKKREELPQKALAPARATCPMIPVIGHVNEDKMTLQHPPPTVSQPSGQGFLPTVATALTKRHRRR